MDSPTPSDADPTDPTDPGDATDPTRVIDAAAGADADDESASRRGVSRRTLTLIVSGVLLLVLVVLAATRPVPYVSIGPGPTFNTLGAYKDTALITVKGRPTYPTTGNLDLTTVTETGGPYGKLGLGEALRGWVDPHIAVVPTRLLYPDQQTSAQIDQQNTADFSGAESSATVAAFQYLGIPVQRVVKVSSVTKGAPADGVLQKGDILVAIDGAKVASFTDARTVIRTKSPGAKVTLTIKRNGKQQDVVVVPKSKLQNGKPVTIVGVTLGESFDSPVIVKYGLTGVGGPSAGLMFSLGLVDKLTPGSLTNGAHIAGTGTIDPSGKVGPIGGIQQKMQGARQKGATIFLAPDSNCGDVRGAIPSGLRVVKVTTLTSAVQALDAIKAGKPTPTC